VNAQLFLNNLLIYAAQIALVAGAAALIVALARLRAPGAKLLFWHSTITACLLLPALRAWKTEVVQSAISVTTSVISMRPVKAAPAWDLPPFAAILLGMIAAGIGLRLIWLVVGLWRLRRFRVHSRPYEGGAQWKCQVNLQISDEVSSPVTFGYRDPVVLLPPRFSELGPEMQEAILWHEMFHVWRRDWVWTLAEEIVRAIFWFHPAVWWMLGEAQLAREQTVDWMVIEATEAREPYLDALLAIANATARLDLAPAPLFLKRRHFKQRVVSIVREVRMSKARLVSTFTASAAMLAGVCWIITGALQLVAAPQGINDAPGVSVATGSTPLIHRSPVMYPAEAIAKGVQGNVTVQVKLGSDGSVVDASVVSGPEELRKAALQSVLNWHFDHSAAGSAQQVSIDFTLPTQNAGTSVLPSRVESLRAELETKSAMIQSRRARVGASLEPKPINNIEISGLSEEAKGQLLAQLPVHEGDTLSFGDFGKLTDAARAFDSHLTVSIGDLPSGFDIRIRPQAFTGITGGLSPQASGALPSLPAPPPPTVFDPRPAAIRVGGNVQQANLITQIRPVYPSDAKAARVQGQVRFEALIGADGYVQNLKVISGPPLLVSSALEAVKQWVYKPTLLNGQPVAVVTIVDVNYTLSQ
jgi:TonB family protein